MPEQVTVLFGLCGGLALFLFGMNAMSEALQKAAGEKMKNILSFLTRNPIMGALAGALVTAVLQSSSATTVMVIGFVSAGLMGLPQAISVIFGANIGTTMTAQLIAFKISDYIYPIIFIGFLVQFFAKKERVKNIGMVIFSFGLLFEGIQIMSSVMEPLAASPIFTDLMGKVKDFPPMGILLGMCMTLVVQSSSATIAVLQSFASQPGPDGVSSVIGLTGAIPILLGDNIGTTITAILASIGQSKNAQRTAIAHSTFNITGSILFAFLIRPFAAFITFISPKGPEVQVISRQIANAHTCFNLVMTLIWLPLIPLMVKWVCFVIRGKDRNEVEAGQPRYLDDKVIAQPVAALYLVSEELRSSMVRISGMLQSLNECIAVSAPAAGTVLVTGGSDTGKQRRAEKSGRHRKGHTPSGGKKGSASSAEAAAAPPAAAGKGEALTPVIVDQRAFAQELAEVKAIQQKTEDYIAKMFSIGSLNQSQAEEASGFLAVASSMERITDRCMEVREQLVQLNEENRGFSPEAREELERCVRAVEKLFSTSTAMLEPELPVLLTGHGPAKEQSGQTVPAPALAAKEYESQAAKAAATAKGHNRQADAQNITKQKNRLRKTLKTFNKNHLARVRAGKCDESLTGAYSGILYSIDRMGDNSVAIAEEAMDRMRLMEAE